METFEPGTTSAYNTKTFQTGERGMKCCACSKVMTMGEWAEKRRCFCQSTNAVPAIARSAPPTRLETNRTTSINSSTTRSNTPSTNLPVSTPNSHTRSSNTPSTNLPVSTPNSHSAISNTSSSSGNTTSNASSSTNYSVSSRTEINSSLSGWGCAAIIFIILLCIGWFITQVGSFSKKNITTLPQPQLNPKEVITKYYQFSTSNKQNARALLSDDWVSYWKKKKQENKDDNFFSDISKIEVYSFQTLTQSSRNSRIKVFLKYTDNNNDSDCESRIMELIFDQSKGQWLIDNSYDVQREECG